MSTVATGAVLFAFLLDRRFGELPTSLHPVVWYGRLIAPLDRQWSHPRLMGLLAVLAALLAGIAVVGVVELARGFHPLAAGVFAGLVLFSTTSLQMLLAEASAVVELSDSNSEEARKRLPALVGRDPSTLSPEEMRSAAVESAAENLADGLVAPLFAFALGALVSLPVAAGAAAFVKAVNTGDSILGYRSKPVGWASARLDDLVMFVPARVSACLLAAAALAPRALTRARSWARLPPSPNSGWPMATVAAAVGSRLEKPGVYTLNPGASLPDIDTASRGISLVRRAGILAFLFAGVVVWF